jgi:hypothetical protein
MNTYFLTLLQPLRKKKESGCQSVIPNYYSKFIFFSGRLIIEDKPENGTKLYISTRNREPFLKLELKFGSKLWTNLFTLFWTYSKEEMNLSIKNYKVRGINLFLRLEDKVIDTIIPQWLISAEK